ncbi:MAG: galactokinase [Terriglobia bacterium]
MQIEHVFRQAFGGEPEVTARAPGRVNLIGEHTDYNGGFVLPAAIDRYVLYAGRRRADGKVRAYSTDFRQEVEFHVEDGAKDPVHRWSNYLRGVVKLLRSRDVSLPGADVTLGGDVPREAGLSSSAAVEVGAAVFWLKLAGASLDPVDLVKLARRAENEFVGVPCGIMDQFISALGRRDHALFLDCRELSYRHVPLCGRVKIVVCNSGVKRALAQSEYEVRLAQCREAVDRLRAAGIAAESLREVSLAELDAHRNHLDEVLYKRGRHVVTENERVLGAVRALEAGDLRSFGELMNQSHESLRDDYQVSCRELDLLVALARKQPGVLGARMTGAGFGGCTVNLVLQDAVEAFSKSVSQDYEKSCGLKAEIYACHASDGALADLAL